MTDELNLVSIDAIRLLKFKQEFYALYSDRVIDASVDVMHSMRDLNLILEDVRNLMIKYGLVEESASD